MLQTTFWMFINHLNREKLFFTSYISYIILLFSALYPNQVTNFVVFTLDFLFLFNINISIIILSRRRREREGSTTSFITNMHHLMHFVNSLYCSTKHISCYVRSLHIGSCASRSHQKIKLFPFQSLIYLIGKKNN